jgi:hypothetical protein
LVAAGINKTNWAFTSASLNNNFYSVFGATRVYVFTGTGGTAVMPAIAGNLAVVPEYYFINNCSGTVTVQFSNGTVIGTIPSGATGTITATSWPIDSASKLTLSIGSNSLGLGQGGQTATYFTYPTRQANVTYTNTTGRPIFVCITLYPPASFWLNAYFYVGGNILWQYNSNGQEALASAQVQLPVPVGAQYYLYMPYLVPNPSYAFYHWYELR